MTPVVSVSDLCLRRGTRDILNGVTFDVAPGEVVALMGLSGSGKTTILRVIAGLESISARELQRQTAPAAAAPSESASRGEAARGGGAPAATAAPAAAAPSESASRGEAARGGGAPRATNVDDSVTLSGRVGMVFQFHYLFEHLTVIDNVCLAPIHVHQVSRASAEARARGLLDELGIGHRAMALPRELSGGEGQRAAIARALAMDPPLLLLDEPTASLDPARRSSLGATLGQLAASGRAILVTSHDVDFVRDHATRVLILADGRVVEAGVPGVVLVHPTHEATRALLQTR